MEMKCVVIGFGAIDKKLKVIGAEGYITNALVKFGPNACQNLHYKYLLYTNRIIYYLTL